MSRQENCLVNEKPYVQFPPALIGTYSQAWDAACVFTSCKKKSRLFNVCVLPLTVICSCFKNIEQRLTFL